MPTNDACGFSEQGLLRDVSWHGMQNGTHRGWKDQVPYSVQMGPEETPRQTVRKDLVVNAHTTFVEHYCGRIYIQVCAHKHTHPVLRYRYNPSPLTFLCVHQVLS